MGGKKKYIEMFGSFTEPFIYGLLVQDFLQAGCSSCHPTDSDEAPNG